MKKAYPFIVATAVVALMAGAANAQSSGAPNSSTTMSPAPRTSGAGTMPSSSLSSADKSFVSNAAKAGMAEVAEAQIAVQKSDRSDVKQFAQRMIDDHGKANSQLQQIAGTKNYKLPTSPALTDEARAKRLQAYSGNTFDKAYISDQVKAHKDAVALFTKESQNGKDADLKQFATQTLPTLKDHLNMINKLASSTGK